MSESKMITYAALKEEGVYREAGYRYANTT
jgi:hypothetical protein